MRSSFRIVTVAFGQAVVLVAISAATLVAQSVPARTTPQVSSAGTTSAATSSPAVASAAPTPAGYVIGPDDVLTVVFWREKDVSGDVTVRPDGRITLPLVGELQAAGLTPEQLVASVTGAAKKYFDDPSVSVVVKQINSRRVFITGAVGKPGTYSLAEHMTVVQLIAVAGGLQEFADKKHITIVHVDRRPDGVPWSDSFNYDDFADRRHLNTNIELKPGDTVIVR